MGTDLNGCWMGNWCQDKSMGGCPAPIGGSELNSGEDICAHMTYTEECSDSQISCDSGYSYEGCWLGNYCIDSVNSWDNCPGMCSTMCNWETENWCVPSSHDGQQEGNHGEDEGPCCQGQGHRQLDIYRLLYNFSGGHIQYHLYDKGLELSLFFVQSL